MPHSVKNNSTNWRLIIGLGLLVTSVIIPLAGIPLVALFNLSTTVTASVSGALLIGSKILGVFSIAVMGKDGYGFVKKQLVTRIKAIALDRPVSRRRYNIGLVFFTIPLLFGWLSGYIVGHFPSFSDHLTYYAIAGDIMLIISLLFLGGDFWEKIRALFLFDMKVSSSTHTESNL